MLSRYLTEQEQRQFLQTIERSAAVLARRDAACVRLLISSGLRIGEFTQITLGDAEDAIHTRYLFIPRERRKGGSRDHSVLFTRKCVRAVRDLLRIRSEMTGGCDLSTLPRNAPLVISRKGGRMTERAWQHRFKVWARAAGLSMAISPHWMRHARAMNIMNNSTSADPRGIVQAALGHASIASTGIYTQTTREELEEQLEIVDGAPRVRKRQLRKLYEEAVG